MLEVRMIIQEEWWKDFFSDRLLDVLRQSKTVENTLAEADFIEKTIRITPPAKVLDVPCGGGRLSIELAARGHKVTGVDVTQSLLDDADRNAKERHLDIKWEHRDMRNLPWQQERI